MNGTEKLCRVCLKPIKRIYFENLGKSQCDILSVLNLEVNLDISEKPVICSDCLQNLYKLFSFKVNFVETEDSLIPFINIQDNKKVDLKQVYLKVRGSKCLEDMKVCRFCMWETPRNLSLELNAIIELALPTNYLLDFFPEVDINLVRDPIICKTCHSFLQDHLIFTTKCLNVEENIQKYIKVEGTNAEGKVDLHGVKQFTDKVIIKKESNDIDIVNHGIQYDWIDVKSENEELKQLIVNSPESTLNIESVEAKENCSKHDAVDTKVYKCDGNVDYSRKAKDMFVLKEQIYETSEIKMNKYEGENHVIKNGLTTHMFIHKDPSNVTMPKCGTESCSFVVQTKQKNKLTKNMLIHKNPSEITMYKCRARGCSYETEQRHSLFSHKLIHKNQSEITIYKCEAEGCSYETKRKICLTTHMLIHKDPSDVTMHKCGAKGCLYESKRKAGLTAHMLVHKDPSDIKMHRCGTEGCSYKTKRKMNLKAHMLMHKDPSEVTMYKCGAEGCSYQTKRKLNLTTHMLIHKDPSEITMYKCGARGCSFETKRKYRLIRHMLTHKNPSEVTMYKCKAKGCSFETKRKDTLTEHMLLHKNPSEMTMYECRAKGHSNEAKRKGRLTRHKLFNQDTI